MEREDSVKEVLRCYIINGLTNPNKEIFLQYVSEDVIGIGMGEQGLILSKGDMRRVMEMGFNDGPPVSYEFSFEDEKVLFHSVGFATICAKVIIRKSCDGEVSNSGLMQSASLKLEDGAWKICALHASPVMLTKESIAAYPVKFADNTLTQLRSEMQSEALDLMNQSISGGMIGTYITAEGKNSLYFINDSMLEMLGYGRAEFCEKFAEEVMALVHEEDVAYVAESIERALLHHKDYSVKFRFLKKDGSSLWVIKHARQTVDKKGRPVLLAVFTDVTEMVELQHKLEQQTALLEEQAEELIMQTEELTAQKEVLETQAQALKSSEERFRIAFEKTSDIIFEYDIGAGRFLEFSNQLPSGKQMVREEDVGDWLIAGARVMGRSLTALRRAFAAVRNGSPQYACTLQAALNTGDVKWYQLSLTGIGGADGEIVKAIGLLEDVTKQKEAELACAREEQYRQAILANSMAMYAINFTKDVFESCQVRDSHCEAVAADVPYENFINQLADRRMHGQDKRNFLRRFSKVGVMTAFENGKMELVQEHHILNPDGTYMWMQSMLRLFVDKVTGEKKGFLYVKDIDASKRVEIALRRKAERDPLTDLYNKGAAEAKIREKLKMADWLRTGAFLMMDLDYFKNVNDTYGHPFGDKVLVGAASILMNQFRADDIVARIGGDEFCVFFRGMRSARQAEELARTLNEAIIGMRIDAPGEFRISCSIGISMCGGIAKSFERIYKEADAALYRVKEKGRNSYAFYS